MPESSYLLVSESISSASSLTVINPHQAISVGTFVGIAWFDKNNAAKMIEYVAYYFA